ncbi:hypothetical protein AB0L88_41820 [Saccharopolyspora shandongensis]|uniref:hypothetical protein n=1 Tax=Saccharopolyspora shandongensis TaxID=418495 RepID=UPI00115FEAD3|nr:hypothetical protein [Saccharopolyspora shandongensis]
MLVVLDGHGPPQGWEPGEQRREHRPQLDPGQRRADAVPRAVGERHVRIARASYAEGRVVEVGERRVDSTASPSWIVTPPISKSSRA